MTARCANRSDPASRISIIINNYNYAPFVENAVESALAQHHPWMETVVVDDGSTDGSRRVLERFRGKARLVFQQNGGQAAAINAGVRASSGEIICFLDADDWWTTHKAETVAAAFAADPRVVLVYHRLQPVQDGRPASRPIPRSLCAGDLAPRMARSAGWWPFPMTSAIAVRRSAWETIGDIPERFRISADAWLVGIYPFVGRVAALPEALGSYRLHGSNNWTRDEDARVLVRNMRHWEATLDVTNAFLARRGIDARLDLRDHLPHRIATARLGGVDGAGRLGLALAALRFAGEPNPVRRLRDGLRLLRDLPPRGIQVEV